jgi:hypothetical protein
LQVFGRRLSFTNAHNFLHVAWFLIAVRLLGWYRTSETQAGLHSLGAWRSVVILPAWTVGVWFLLPKRLGYFLAYLSPTDTDQIREHVPFMHGAPLYFEAMLTDYHATAAAFAIALGLAAVGLLAFRWWRPGTAVIVTFVVVAALLTFQHPMLKSRFLHSWLPAGWVLAGVGFATVACAPWWRSRLANVGLSFAGIAGLLVMLAPSIDQPGPVPPGIVLEGGMHPERPSILALTDTYLDELADAREPTLLSNVHAAFLLSWTYQERYPLRPFATEIKGYSADPEANRDAARRWLESTRSDALVLLEIPPRSPYNASSPENRDYGPLRQCLKEQTIFHQTGAWNLPNDVSVTLWRRTDAR